MYVANLIKLHTNHQLSIIPTSSKMTENTRIPNPDKSEPKYRKKLNEEQVAVLNLLYTFRFASNEHIARYQKKPNSKHVQKRLRILEDQGLIAKRYDKSYRLKGKPAAYYMLPKGARALMVLGDRDENEPINIKRIYKDKDVSEGFIQHSFNVLSAYLTLSALHGNKLDFFTKSDLNYEQFEFYPQPLSDAHVRISAKDGDKNFFLDIFEDTQPFFVLIRRIKKYLEYAGSGDWPEEPLPTILLVVENKSVHKRLRKRIAKELRDSYEELPFATARLERLLDPEYKGKVWLPIDEDGDDPEEPREPVILAKLPEA
jgi:hypothetical protein